MRATLFATFSYCIIFFLLLFFGSYLTTHFRRIYLTVYTTFEYLFFFFFIYQVVLEPRFKRLMIFFSALFVAFECWFYFETNSKDIDSVPIGIETILILFFIVYCFYEQFRYNFSRFIYTNYWFWTIVGILCYLSCSFFFNILASSFEYDALQPYWYITFIFEIIKNLFFTFGVYLLSKEKIDSTLRKTEVPNLDMM